MSQSIEKNDNTPETTGPGDGASGLTHEEIGVRKYLHMLCMFCLSFFSRVILSFLDFTHYDISLPINLQN